MAAAHHGLPLCRPKPGLTLNWATSFPLRSHCTASYTPLGAILGPAPVRSYREAYPKPAPSR